MTIKTILVAIDVLDADGAMRVIEGVRSIADTTGADVRLLHVLPTLPTRYSRYLRAEFEAGARADALKELTRLVTILDRPNDTVSVVVRQGRIAAEVVAEANARDADLVIVGAHFGVIERLMGSNAVAIMRDSACDVLVIKRSVQHLAEGPATP